MALFSNVKFLLIVGKLIFLIPCDGFLWNSHEDFVLRWNSFPSVISFLIIVWCIAKDIVGFKFLMHISRGGVVGYVHPAHYFLISSIITIIYVYFFINAHKLKRLFVVWDQVASNFNLNVFALKRVTYFGVFPMILPFIINSLFAIDGVRRLDGQVPTMPTNVSRLEHVYDPLLKNWHGIVPFSEYFTIFCVLDFVWGSFPRSFILASVTVFSYALSRQFKDLVEKTRAGSEGTLPDQEFWLHAAKKHNSLTNLVEEFDSFFSPLIFTTYLTSLYLICVQLLRALSSNFGGGIGAELTLGLSPIIFNASFCVEVFYLYVMSISAAQINYYAQWSIIHLSLPDLNAELTMGHALG